MQGTEKLSDQWANQAHEPILKQRYYSVCEHVSMSMSFKRMV